MNAKDQSKPGAEKRGAQAAPQTTKRDATKAAKKRICAVIAEMLRRTATVLVLSGGFLYLAAMAASPGKNPGFTPPEPGTYVLPVIKLAADGSVLDEAGKPVQLRELTRGRVTVLSFIYTRCADAAACPHAMGVLNELHELSTGDAALAKALRLVSMSFDPENDTPERLQAYSAMTREREGAAQWKFVTARDQAALEPILKAYDQAVDRKKNPDDPLGPLSHTLRVYLIDPVGRIRNIYSSGTLDQRLVLADIRTLLLEKTAAARGKR